MCAIEPMESEDPLFTLYTSGSTGKPKGLVHSQAGYLLYAGLTHQVHLTSPHTPPHTPPHTSHLTACPTHLTPHLTSHSLPHS